MSIVNADADLLLQTVKNLQTAISSIEATKSSITTKYQHLAGHWNDKKYAELGEVVLDCTKSLNSILKTLLQGKKYVVLLVKSLQEYESVQFGGSDASVTTDTPGNRQIVVSPFNGGGAFPSDTFGTQIALVQDRLSDERYFSRGEHFEEYRSFWENGDFSYTQNENPEIVYVRARDIEGVYIWDRERDNPQGFWTRHGRQGWSRENIMRRASRIQDVRQNLEHGISIEEMSQNPDLDETIGSYFREPVQVASLGSFYVFQSDGRHRILAAQTLDAYIPVLVTTRYSQN